MNIIQTNDLNYSELIVEQYIRIFSTGLSAQLLNKKEVNDYIYAILIQGYAVLAFDNDVIAGSLLATPLLFDNELPTEIITKFTTEKSIYIAELMVEEDKRGMGIGNQLMDVFYNQIDRTLYSDVFIRVWEENKAALRLYEKSGYKSIATITQTKIATDGFSQYIMKKVYLHKRID